MYVWYVLGCCVHSMNDDVLNGTNPFQKTAFQTLLPVSQLPGCWPLPLAVASTTGLGSTPLEMVSKCVCAYVVCVACVCVCGVCVCVWCVCVCVCVCVVVCVLCVWCCCVCGFVCACVVFCLRVHVRVLTACIHMLLCSFSFRVVECACPPGLVLFMEKSYLRCSASMTLMGYAAAECLKEHSPPFGESGLSSRCETLELNWLFMQAAFHVRSI